MQHTVKVAFSISGKRTIYSMNSVRKTDCPLGKKLDPDLTLDHTNKF